MMKAAVDPWYQSLADPAKAQATVLEQLLTHYKQTEYGKTHGAETIGSYEDYKNSFPVQTYAGFKPFIDEVLAGKTHALLSEAPEYIGLTKGTSGESKLFPFTHSHAMASLNMVLRLSFNYAITKHNFEWLSGCRLNLASSANVGTIKVGEKEMPYGYSIAVGMRILEASSRAALNVTPTQDEMDALPKEATKANWEKRFELAYEKGRDKNITHILTSPDATIGFGRWLQRTHRVKAQDLWHVTYVMSTGYAGTHTRFVPPIHALYGSSTDVRELYISSEAAFGGQIDDGQAWVPFYDNTFFEIQTINGVKQMHEMIPGEIGSLVVSTTSLPRYRIGDLILAFEPPYFRCIGRDNTKLHPYSYGKLTGKSELHLGKSPELPAWR
jgi:hypothetical protein